MKKDEPRVKEKDRKIKETAEKKDAMHLRLRNLDV